MQIFFRKCTVIREHLKQWAGICFCRAIRATEYLNHLYSRYLVKRCIGGRQVERRAWICSLACVCLISVSLLSSLHLSDGGSMPSHLFQLADALNLAELSRCYTAAEASKGHLSVLATDDDKHSINVNNNSLSRKQRRASERSGGLSKVERTTHVQSARSYWAKVV